MGAKLKIWATEAKYFLSNKFVLKNLGGMLGIALSSFLLIMLFVRLYTRHNSYVTIPSYIGKTVEQAQTLDGNRYVELRIVDTTLIFDKTKQAGEIISQDPAPNAQAKKNRIVYVTINALKSHPVRFPDIWGDPIDQVLNTLNRKGFKDIEIEKRPDRAVNTVLEVRIAGTDKIIEEYKKEGQFIELKPETKLILVVAEGSTVKASVPSLICQTYKDALAMMQTLEFSKGAVVMNGVVSDMDNAYVWRQSPSAYDSVQVNIGDPIDVWIQAEEPFGCKDDNNNTDVDEDDWENQ